MARCAHVCHCHIQSMLSNVVVAVGSIYGGNMHMQHELQQNCVTVTEQGVQFRRLQHV